MPNKYPEKKGWDVPKQKYKLSNWPEYNESLRRRGSIDVWLSEDAISQWYETDRVYIGTGAPKRYSDFAIRTCHEIRLVYRLPLRQSQGFIDSLFRQMGIDLDCPDYTVLSKRLAKLNIKVPQYRIKKDRPDESIHAIAIDSTGLKRFGRGEWHQEKYELSSKASWRKLHVAVNQDHYIEACELTDRFSHDESQVGALLEQIQEPIDHFSGDGAYDKTPVYDAVANHSPTADIVIPPGVNAVEKDKAAPLRNRNIREIKEYGRMQWQKNRGYGRRNYSELGVQRYQKIFGESLHARDIKRQKQETKLACGALNKMTFLGMPQSYRSA
jgi:hypothetical protein